MTSPAAGRTHAAAPPGSEVIRPGGTRPLRVLVVTTVHTPLDARIHHRQIRALLAAGAEVAYAAPWTATRTPRTAAAPGVRCIDLPRAVGRRRLDALLAARRLVRRAGDRADLVLLHDPELLLAVLGRLPRLPPVVLDVHEDLPASLTDRRWLPARLRPLAVRTARWLEATAAHRLAGLLLAEDSYRARLPGPHPVVPNLPWLPSHPPPAGRDRRVVYVGRLSTGRGAMDLLALARRLAAAETGQEPIHLDLVGPADAEVVDAVQTAHDAGEVTWHGFLPNDQALALVEGAIAGLAPLHDLDNYRGSMPTKVVEYLAHGVPAIVTPLPEAAALVRAGDAGVVVDFEDPEALTAAVLALASEPGRAAELGARGRAYVAEHRSWDVHGPAFVAHLRDLAATAPPSTGGRGRWWRRRPRVRRAGRSSSLLVLLALTAMAWTGLSQPAGAAEPCPPPLPGVVAALPDGARTVALTIDDGPHPVQTPRMLEVLAEQDVRATFFVIGRNVRDHPELARRIVEEGHLLANHTFSHPRRPDHMDALPVSERVREIDRATRVIEEATGVTPCFYRSPQGFHRSPETIALAHERRMTVSHWTISSMDTLQPAEEDEDAITELVERVTVPLREGGILLFHDGGGAPKPNSAPAVSRTIDAYRAAGFRFVDPAGRPIPGVDPELVHLCPAGIRLALPFADVALDSPHRHAIACATQQDVLSGRTAGVFSPHEPITRGQAASMLDRFLQRTDGVDSAAESMGTEDPASSETIAFADVDPGNVHAPAIERMATAGLLTGRADGTFQPATAVRRDQLASMLAAVLAQVQGPSDAPATTGFVDVPMDHPHARGIAIMSSIGIATGRGDDRFDPELPVSRAQAAALLVRLDAWLAQR